MRNILTVFLLLSAILAPAQKPAWVNDRDYFPATQYLTGYATNTGTETSAFIQSLRASAKAELAESIRVSVTSLRELYKSERAGIYSEDYASFTSAFANADINGLKTDYYYDRATHSTYTMEFEEDERGKTLYIALCWQNGKGQHDPWSDIEKAIIP